VKIDASAVIFGGSGLVGSGIKNALDSSIVIKHIAAPSSRQINLMDLPSVSAYLEDLKPDLVIMAAGQVGGILFNSLNQQEQFKSNFLMNFNVIEASLLAKVPSFYLISSSCIYPEAAQFPMTEKDIFNGLPHSTNEGYAIAKSAAVRQVLLYRRIYGLDWKVLVPTNVYGTNEKFKEGAHVIPQLISKIAQAIENNSKSILISGDGSPIREFLLDSELGNAVRYLIDQEIDFDLLNISSGEPITILELAKLICRKMNFGGQVKFDLTAPNGHPNKTLDISFLEEIGWKNSRDLNEGIGCLVDDFFSSKEAREKLYDYSTTMQGVKK